MHTPYKVIKKRLNLAKWIGQSQQKAWLQTQAPGTTQLVREQYATQWVVPTANAPRAQTPALCVVFGVNTLQSVATIIASVRFRCKYSFRCRAALDNAPVFGMAITYTRGKDGKVYRSKEEFDDEEGMLAHQDELQPPSPVSTRDRSLESLTRSQLITLIK